MGKRDTKGGLAGYYDSDVGFLSEPDMQDIWVPKYRYVFLSCKVICLRHVRKLLLLFSQVSISLHIKIGKLRIVLFQNRKVCDQIDVTDSLSFFNHISVVCGSIWTFFAVLPLKEAISDGRRSENARYRCQGGGYLNFK